MLEGEKPLYLGFGEQGAAGWDSGESCKLAAGAGEESREEKLAV